MSYNQREPIDVIKQIETDLKFLKNNYFMVSQENRQLKAENTRLKTELDNVHRNVSE